MTAQEKIHALEQTVLRLEADKQKLESEVDKLWEQLRLMKHFKFGRRSEKANRGEGNPDQISIAELLGLPEPPAPPPQVEVEKIKVPEHMRKKSGRRALPKDLERIEITVDLPEEQKQCACGCMMTRIGEERSEKLDYVPAVMRIVETVRPKYACNACEGELSEAPAVQIAPMPKSILPKSNATAGLLAHIVVSKFVDSLPFYRQEQQFARLGVEISRTTLSVWTSRLGANLEKLGEALLQSILSGPLIHIDETTFQVLHEAGRLATTKSFMWVLRGGDTTAPGVYFHYSPTRSSSVAYGLLGEYCGVVVSDGYVGYDFLKNISTVAHAGCWAHCRRKFKEVIKAQGANGKPGKTEEALRFITALYNIERRAKKEGLNASEILELRQKESRPILEQFRLWLEDTGLRTPPKGLLGKAIGYALSQWEKLTTFLNHGFAPIDNNAAENAIRPFVVGRKNWLFNNTVTGAKASALFYSLIESAKANRLNPFVYLKNLFERFPYAETEADIHALLPQNIILS